MTRRKDIIMNISTDQILEVMRQAGQIMLRAHDMEDDGNVTAKPGTTNFVTVYDVAVQNFLIEKFSEIFPDAVYFAEEKDNRAEDALNAPLCFIIDPIDGTTNFVNLRRNFAVSVGCYRDNQPVFGLVLDVIRKDLYSAFAGEGAYKNAQKLGEGRVPENLGEMILSTPNVQDAFWRGYPQQNAMLRLADEVRAVRCMGSVALELCQVAEGTVDIFVAMRSAPWDHNAARLILQEAGCYISQLGEDTLCLDRETSVYACRSRGLAEKLRTEYGF
jgi:fructose-1,6-bisphosphatase/inositol monophosphatase family enzyme